MGGWGTGGPRDGLKERAPDISAREQGWKATGISASSAAWPFRGRVAEGKKLTGGVRLPVRGAGRGLTGERAGTVARARGEAGRALLAAGPCGAMVSWAERIARQAERNRAACGVRVRVSAGPRGACGETSWASLLGPCRRRRGSTGPRGEDGLGCFGFGLSLGFGLLFYFYFLSHF